MRSSLRTNSSSFFFSSSTLPTKDLPPQCQILATHPTPQNLHRSINWHSPRCKEGCCSYLFLLSVYFVKILLSHLLPPHLHTWRNCLTKVFPLVLIYSNLFTTAWQVGLSRDLKSLGLVPPQWERAEKINNVHCWCGESTGIQNPNFNCIITITPVQS